MVGSSEVTRLKWQRLTQLLDAHTKMVVGVLNGPSRREAVRSYHYIDLYAGPGLYEPKHSEDLAGCIGSPLIALRRLSQVRDEHGLEFLPYFGEADPKTADDLSTSLVAKGYGAYVKNVVTACCASSVAKLSSSMFVGRRRYGLVFVDPNGYPDWDALREFSMLSAWYCVDILINVNATIHKRCRKSSTHAETLKPTDHLRSLGKKYVSLWAPPNGDPHQFSLAYCTNWKALEFGKQGFHPLDSPKGQAIARLIDYTDRERKELPPLDGFLPGADWGDIILNRDGQPTGFTVVEPGEQGAA